MRDNPLLGCLALIGGFVVLVFLLSTFWTLAISMGPIGFGLLIVVVFAVGYVLGGGR